MKITKLRHKKLLAAIRTAQEYAARQSDVASAAHEKLGETERALKLEKDAAGLAAVRLDLAHGKIKRLRQERHTRDETIVQLGIRLAAYGDPQTAPDAGFISPEKDK